MSGKLEGRASGKLEVIGRGSVRGKVLWYLWVFCMVGCGRLVS